MLFCLVVDAKLYRCSVNCVSGSVVSLIRILVRESLADLVFEFLSANP